MVILVVFITFFVIIKNGVFCEMVILVVFNSFNVVKNLKKPNPVARQMPPFYTTHMLLPDFVSIIHTYFHKTFQEWHTITHVCAHTCKSVKECDKLHTQIKLLTTYFYYKITCV